MTRTPLKRRKYRPRRDAFTLAEAVVSTVVVAVMLVAALNTVGAAKLGVQKTGDRGRGTLLAQQLMSEILRQDYADAAYGPDSFGRIAAEAGPGNRSLYDDVDDYHGWSASPPQDKAGNALPNLDGWRRSVTVKLINPSNPEQIVATDLGLKRIAVTVACNDVDAATMVAWRSRARGHFAAE